MGLTQNCNESLHSVVWNNAPKIKRIGQKSLQAAAAIAVCTFNEGSMILAARVDHGSLGHGSWVTWVT